MTNSIRCIIYTIVGGLAFWAPDVLLHYRKGSDFELSDVWLLALLMPWALFAFYRALWRWGRQPSRAPSLAAYMLLGVWLLGPTAMMTGATFSYGGWALPGTEVWGVIERGIFPPFTLMMSTYDGSSLALILGTVLMCLMHRKYEKHHWIVPPVIFHTLKKLFAPSPYK